MNNGFKVFLVIGETTNSVRDLRWNHQLTERFEMKPPTHWEIW
jgi:hypothetical protein